MATPQVLSRKVNGVASAASNSAPADAPKPTKTKAPVEGEKVVIRRLAPGMTEEEFTNILGDAWKSGNGKVGWFSYHPGKISKDPAKPSRPSRAYLHVLRRDELLGLSDAVRTSVWEDARESWTDPALVGPPVVEQCIYKKIPSGKRRTDGRQGTIDQDREFMAFLESLANPDAHKDGEGEHSTDDASKPERATTTPLIEYLKEKKANKAKETAAAKSAKHSRQESQGGGKSKGSSASPEESKKKSKGDKSSDKPKETVKILTKKAATDAAADAAKSAAAQIQGGTQELPKSRRAGIAAAARILQRDLGLSPGNAHRKARQEAAKAEAEAKTATAAEKDTAASSSAQTPASPTVSTAARPATPTAPKAQQGQQAASSSSSRSRGKKRGTGEDSAKGKGEKSTADGAGSTPAKTTPVLLLKKKDESQLTASQSARPSTPSASTSGPTSAATPAPTGPKSTASKSSQPAPSNSKKSTSGGAAGPSAAPNPNATRAFVKHANPSQGVTEPLLKEAMIAFGEVTFVEIDRRKGFAYVDFAEPEGLARAIAANPVTVAQAAVQILERRDKEAAAGRRGGGGGGKSAAGGGGGNSKGDAGPSSVPATPTTPAGPATDKDKGTAPAAGAASEKRGGRRRGGRGRDRDRDGGAKDGAGGGGKNAGKSGGGGGGGGGGGAAAAAATTT